MSSLEVKDAQQYWHYNVPLGATTWDSGEVMVLNFAPRTCTLHYINVNEVLYGLTQEQFFMIAAMVHETWGSLFSRMSDGWTNIVHYPHEDEQGTELVMGTIEKYISSNKEKGKDNEL